MEVKVCLFLLSIFFGFSHQISTPESPDYVAGVVEFMPEGFQQTTEQRTEKHMLAYMEMIESEEAQEVDIIVFPESTLNRRTLPTFVPKPDEQVTPCDDDKYAFFLRNISCSARTHRKYVVINLSEKHICTAEEQAALNDTRKCGRDGFSYYNTNVVLDRNGVVISTYRKYNLFGETGINTTLVSDKHTFTTDFGVTFGHFICFDILFEKPAIELIRMGVRDFVYPAMWFSELPFLTSVQTQNMWAWKHNVNFLGAGASNPKSGSTGSGIFAGRKGPLTYVMSATPMRRLLVARVPKIDTVTAPFTHDPVAVKFTEKELLNLTLSRDPLDIYTTMLVDVTRENSNQKLCFDKLCCHFNIKLQFDESLITSETDYYRYRLGVFDGVRSFKNVANGGILNCGVFACATDELSSCGKRITNTDSVVPAITFESIKITGQFPSNSHVLTLPNALNNFINPINYNDLTYVESEEFIEAGETVRDIHMELTTPHNDLRAFSIYGRNFIRDDEGVTTSGTKSVTSYDLPLVDVTIGIF